MPVYRCPDFHCVRAGGSTRGSTRGPRGPKNTTTKFTLQICIGSINGPFHQFQDVCVQWLMLITSAQACSLTSALISAAMMRSPNKPSFISWKWNRSAQRSRKGLTIGRNVSESPLRRVEEHQNVASNTTDKKPVMHFSGFQSHKKSIVQNLIYYIIKTSYQPN